MPQEITKDDGSKETVYSAAEVEAAKKEAETKAAAPFQEQLTAKDAELATAKEALAKANDKDANFSALRTKVENLERDKATLQGQIETAVQSATIKARVDTAIETITSGDQNVREKTQFHYDRLAKATPPKNEAEAAKLVREAYVLATQKEPQGPDTLNSIVSSAGGAGVKPPAAGGASTELNEIQKKVGAGLGITEEDAKKYPPGSIPTQTISKK